jgi:hypothetical protein
MEKLPARPTTHVSYATIPMRDKAEVVRRDTLRARAEAALKQHRKTRSK